MMSSLDWAGLVPAIAAAVQTAAVVAQVYWDRRQRGARMTRRPVCGEPVPGCVGPEARGCLAVHVQVGVLPSRALVSVIVRVGEAGGANGMPLPPAKGHGPW
ncbi:hypothetical protein [Streptomyces sp. NPDC001927]